MDYWGLARNEIKTVISSLSSVKELNGAARTFIEHASIFGEGKPIRNYPRWSDDLGSLRDDLLQSGGNPLVGEIANLLTMLIWKWEYGAMAEVGFRSSQDLAALAKTLQDSI